MKQLTLILSFLILASITSIAQRPADKFENKIFHFENDSIKYRLFVPEDYLSSEPLPLILTLHGLAECGSDNNQHIITHRIAETWAEDSSQQKNAAYIISPQIPKRSNSLDHLLEYLTIYWFSGVDALLDSMIIKYPIDTARIYLTGLSLGAINTWWLIYNHSPNRFAAAIPISGGWLGEWLPQNMEPQISGIPVWAFCGSNDYEWDMIHKVRNMVSNIENEGYNVIRKLTNYGDVGLTRNEIDSLNAEGIKHIYTEFTDGSHENVYDLTYDDPALHYWLFSQVKSETTPLDEKGEWIVYDTSNSELPSNQINYIVIDEDNTKWIGTFDGLAKFDNTNWTIYNESNSGLPSNAVYSIALDGNGNMWVGTGSGLAKFDNTNWTVYDNYNSTLPDNLITSIAIDISGIKWIGTVGGLAKIEDSNWTVYNESNSGLPDNVVSSLAIDGSGNIWIGTGAGNWRSGGGLAMFDGTNWTVYDTSNSVLPHNDVSSLAIDGSGYKWIATYWKGLAKFDDTNWTVYDTSNSSLPSNMIECIAIDNAGNKWIGPPDTDFTIGYLAKFDGTYCTVYDTSNSGLPYDKVNTIAIDANDNKWIGTYAGLAVFNEDGIVSVEENQIREIVPKEYLLYQNYPNPFNPTTTIKYQIPKLSNVTLKLFDVLGSEVVTLVNKQQPQGYHEVEFDGSELTSGIYFYRLQAGDFVETKKMILLK